MNNSPDKPTSDQPEPVQPESNQSHLSGAEKLDAWESKENYRSIVDSKIAVEESKTSFRTINLVVAVLFLLLIVLSFPEIGSYLPTIPKDPNNYRSIPASPVIGLLYLSIFGLLLYEFVVAIKRQNAKNRQKAGLVKKKANPIWIVILLIGGGIFMGPGAIVLPFIIFAPILCNFSTCSAS